MHGEPLVNVYHVEPADENWGAANSGCWDSEWNVIEPDEPARYAPTTCVHSGLSTYDLEGLVTANTTTEEITPQDYGIHVSCPTGFLRTAYGHPAAVAYYDGRSWVARPMTDFRPDEPGPHGSWKVPGHDVTADTYEDAFAALGFPHDLDLDRPQGV